MTRREYSEYMTKRADIISENRSRRMRVPTQPPLPVPPKISPPAARVAYTRDGSYVGRLADDQLVPHGCVVKLEEALW